MSLVTFGVDGNELDLADGWDQIDVARCKWQCRCRRGCRPTQQGSRSCRKSSFTIGFDPNILSIMDAWEDMMHLKEHHQWEESFMREWGRYFQWILVYFVLAFSLNIILYIYSLLWPC
jgi:hypothetical protein